MSQKNLNKTINFSQSPSMAGLKKASKSTLSASPLNETDHQAGTIKISHSLNHLPKNLSKLIKITKKNFEKNNNSLGIHIRDSSKYQGYLSTSTKQFGVEDSLKKKLDKELKLKKKLEIFLNFSEKLSEKSKTFQAFFAVFSEVFEVVQDELKILEKFRESEMKLNEKCENMRNEIDRLKDENFNFLVEIEKLKKEEKILKSTCRKQSILLNNLKNAGFPVEELYENSKKTTIVEFDKVRERSIEKETNKGRNLSKEKGRKRDKVSEKKIPKLQLKIEGGDIGYHQEFMAKFKEFSESWREQILKEQQNKSN